MHGIGWGFGGLFEALQSFALFVGTLAIAGVLIGLAVLLARYLLVATKASQLYLDLNSAKTAAPAATPAAPEPVAPEPAPAPEPAAPEPATPAPARRAPAKPRTPKP